MRHRIGPLFGAVAVVAALFTPTVHAETGSAIPTPAAQAASPEAKAAALEAYENLDVEAARAEDPAGFDRRLEKLSSSPAMTQFLDRYSVDPSGELKRLAALMGEDSIDSFLAKTKGKYIVPDADGSGLALADEPPAPEPTPNDDGMVHPNAKCWKSFVGIGAFTWVTGFYCALTGVMSVPCLTIAAIAGDEINWDRYC